MKNVILLSLILLPFLMFSQSRSSIDFIVSPDITYRIFNTFEGDNTFKRIYDSLENANLGIHLGINYNHRISKKMYLSGGVHYSKMGYHIKKDNLIWGSEIDSTGSGIITIDPTLSHSVKFSYDYFLISFPIELRYLVSNNTFSPYFKVGIAPAYNFYRRTKSTFDIGEDRIQKDYDISHLTAFLQIGIGLNLNLNEKWSVFAQPTFRYQLIAVKKNTSHRDNLYSIGIELGARMSL
jgi:Outer membrane protein beta-barrel domain